MDNHASAVHKETLKVEKMMATKWLMETDLSDAKDLPAEQIYRSESISQQPYQKHLVQPTKGFKPKISRENFERAKQSFGMVASKIQYDMAAKDPRPPCQVFRNTGREDEVQMKLPPPALRNLEYYGKPGCTKEFYSRHGAFAAVEDKIETVL
eukprot:gnl/MRDRNA2_/MRDRNA2_89924_c0_seq1.p1 gnl/MRDRNA2_/MRDRNA2_89924_c0~~gnl/MRDRNA2_/MRDRNA2_89924_c0_seq1.p1  ORF type:complete len:153 (+),score=39.63 gnl/MRDRNA2_/MRDRNA2_89924_c0_seq1:96-554(+)